MFHVKADSVFTRGNLDNVLVYSFPAVTCSVTASPEEYRNICICWEITSRLCFRIQRSVGPFVDTRTRQSMEAGGFSPFFHVMGAARRLVLDSGYTLVRQSTEFMLHFTYFYVKVTLRSMPVLLSLLMESVHSRSFSCLPVVFHLEI